MNERIANLGPGEFKDLKSGHQDFARVKIAGATRGVESIRWIIGIAIPAAIAITGIVVGIVVQVLNQVPG